MRWAGAHAVTSTRTMRQKVFLFRFFPPSLLPTLFLPLLMGRLQHICRLEEVIARGAEESFQGKPFPLLGARHLRRPAVAGLGLLGNSGDRLRNWAVEESRWF